MRTTITAQLARFAAVGPSAGAWRQLAPTSLLSDLGTVRHHSCHDAGATVLPDTGRAAVASIGRAAVACTGQPPRGSRS
jgi:hypothetical protein